MVGLGESVWWCRRGDRREFRDRGVFLLTSVSDLCHPRSVQKNRPSLAVADLDFEYPEHLVATERARGQSRIMLVAPSGEPAEINRRQLLSMFRPGDLLVLNNTRVLRRRIFTDQGLEILFIRPIGSERREWEVLCPSSRWKAGTEQTINDANLRFELVARGRPQTLRANVTLSEELFERLGELPLPPYIQKARGERHMRAADSGEYQSIFARPQAQTDAGSLAAPTASFHFDQDFLGELKASGVSIAEVTLHVGLGTFLPVTVDDLRDHVMHHEWAEISAETVTAIRQTKESGGRVMALGTTVARTLESMHLGMLPKTTVGGYFGETDLLIQPGHGWGVVDVLMTNFHQPRSTLLALVASFSSLERVKASYAWAIRQGFRLFSYGDFSVWLRD